MFLKQFVFWLLATLGIFPVMLSAQEIVFSTQPSAYKVGLQDQFQVSFILQNAPSNPSDFDPPDFTGFRVLAGPIQSSQSNISIVNGKTQRSNTLQLSYVLQPGKKGNLTINGASVKIGGQTYTSNSVNIQVVPGSVASRQQRSQRDHDPFGDDQSFQAMQRQAQRMMQQMQQQMQPQPNMQPIDQGNLSELNEKNLKNNVFIKVSVDHTHPYVGQQITASYKLYTRLPMNMSLTQLPSLNGFWSEDFKIPNPPKPSIEKINGKEYQVFLLKKSALFPQHSGKLTLDPAEAEGVVRVIEKSNAQSPLANDPGFGSLFMNDPFFDNNFFSRYQYKDVKTKLSSPPVTITVQSLPANKPPSTFTGAVGQFTVQSKIDSTTLFTGNSTNFTFTIKGSGNFKLIGNPDIVFPTSLSALDPLVADTITSRTPTITGQKTFTYNLSPQTAGEYTIPSIAFSYFDPVAESYKTLHTTAIKIHVKQGNGSLVSKNTNGSVLPKDIHPNFLGKQRWKVGSFLFVASPWYWGLYLLGLLAFIGAWYFSSRKNAMEANLALWKNKKANKVAWKRLSTARKLLAKNEAHTAFYEETSKALWLYLSDKLNIPLSVLTKENIAEKLRSKNISEEQISRLHELLSECEMALYSPGGGQKQRGHTLDAAFELIGSLENELHKNKNIITHAS